MNPAGREQKPTTTCRVGRAPDDEGRCELSGSPCPEITERRRMEHQLRKEKIAAEEKVRNYARFLAGMSHDLRTPMNAIMGYADMLRLGVHKAHGEDQSKAFAEAIMTAGSHLLDLINDFLDLYRIDAEKLDLREESVSANELLEDAAVMIRERAESAGIDFTATGPTSDQRLFIEDALVLERLGAHVDVVE